MDGADLDSGTWNLADKTPNASEGAPMGEPAEIIDAILARDGETAKIVENIRGRL